MEKLIISNPSSLGLKIRRLRKTMGLNLMEFADSIGITHSYLSQIERGKKTAPSLELLYKIASILGLSLSELMDVQNYTPPHDESYRSEEDNDEDIDEVDENAKILDIFEITDYFKMKGLTCDNKLITKEESSQIVNFARFLISQQKAGNQRKE